MKFNYSGRIDDALRERDGQNVTVVRQLTAGECDINDVGPMYRVKFPDGHEDDAFADELDGVTVIAPRLIAEDDTEYFDLGDDAVWIKKIESVYLYDENRIVHCCDLQGSYWLEPLYTCIEFVEGIDDDRYNDLTEKYGFPALDGCYRYVKDIEPTVILEDEGYELGEDYTYDDALDAVVDYYRCNWYYG